MCPFFGVPLSSSLIYSAKTTLEPHTFAKTSADTTISLHLLLLVVLQHREVLRAVALLAQNARNEQADKIMSIQ
jgi:hypothetical protein